MRVNKKIESKKVIEILRKCGYTFADIEQFIQRAKEEKVNISIKTIHGKYNQYSNTFDICYKDFNRGIIKDNIFYEKMPVSDFVRLAYQGERKCLNCKNWNECECECKYRNINTQWYDCCKKIIL